MSVLLNGREYYAVMIVGCGGIGSYVAPNIVRMISNHTSSRMRATKIIFADPDIVEQKNITRQNFSNADVGKNKAQALADRYSAVFGVPIYAHKEKVAAASIRNIAGYEFNRVIVIDCVDNVAFRYQLNQHLVNTQNDYHLFCWLSVGNTETDGQIVLYDPSSQLRKTPFTEFPHVFNTEAFESEKLQEERRNCGENVVSNPQSLAINIMGATLVSNMMYELVYEYKNTNDTILYDIYNQVTAIKRDEPLIKQEDLSSAFSLALS